MRKLTELEISELSLVDRPANLTPFMIIKNDEKPKWDTVERLIFGYSRSDLELLDDQAVETIEPIEKMSKDNPFPSITRQINLQKKKGSDYLNELEA